MRKLERSCIINQQEENSSNELAHSKEKLQLYLYDLYFKNLLSDNEVAIISEKISKIQEIGELKALAEEIDQSDSSLINQEDEKIEEFLEINEIKKLFQQCKEELQIDNWQSTLTSLMQKINTINSSLEEYHQFLIKSWLADFLENLYFFYIENKLGNTNDFSQELKKILDSTNQDIPDFLQFSQGQELNKRRPSFLESVDATLERFESLEQLASLFKNLSSGIIVGGSMSYGPFFNIRKDLDHTGSSDLDLIAIVEEGNFNSSLWQQVADSDLLSKEEARSFLSRIDKFKKLFQDGETEIFSQKFQVEGKDFYISIHFFPPKVFNRMIGDEFSDDLLSGADKVAVIKDYKARDFVHPECAQQNFLGQAYRYVVPEQRKVDEGVVTELPGYIIHGNHFYPGIYQNLISPRFSVTHGSDEIKGKIAVFRTLLEDRFTQEKEDFPQARFTNSHIRNRIFSSTLISKHLKNE